MSGPWTSGPWEWDGWDLEPSVLDIGIGYDGLFQGTPPSEANARLIALAPEMAELLADIAKNYAPESGASSWVGRAYDLLARARGEA